MSNDHPAEKKPAVVITGSTGLIGTRVADQLAGDFTLYGLDVKQPAEPSDTIQTYKCDLTDDQSVADALEKIRGDAGDRIASVVHLAAYYDFSGEPSPLYQQLTVEGTRRLLRNLQSFQVEQFIFSSSMLVMAPVEEGEKIDESSPTDAEWDYPESKLAAEEVIKEAHDGIPAVVLRIAGVYDDFCRSIPIAQQIKRIYEHDLESHFYPGDESHGQPFIHLDDVAGAIRQTVCKRHELGDYEMLLVAEDDLMSYGELQDRIGELLHGTTWTTVRIPKAVAKAGAWVKDTLTTEDEFIKPWMVDLSDDHYPVDVSRAKERLDWRPRRSLRETLPEMIDALTADPVGWYEGNKLGQPPPDRLGDVVVDEADVTGGRKGKG